MTPRTTGMASDEVDEWMLLVSELPSHIPMVNAGLYDAIQRSFGFWSLSEVPVFTLVFTPGT
jgi:hypothetical protein